MSSTSVLANAPFGQWVVGNDVCELYWSDTDFAAGFVVCGPCIGLLTARENQLPLTITLVETFGDPSGSHVIESDIVVDKQLSVFDVHGQTVASVKAGAGLYRLRYSITNLDKIAADGLSGQDSYLIEIMPTKSAGPAVVVVAGEFPGG